MDHILSSNYNRENWIKFLQNQFLPSDFSLRSEQIDIDFQSKYIKPQAYWIGDCESLGDLAIIEIAHSSENDPRIGVSRDAFRLMAEHGLSKALFFFVSDNSNNYRFSLITLDLKLEGTDVKYKFSNPKRFSFFLGEEAKIHTPEEFLFEKGRIKDFEDLQSRFSIEVVNKEFYHEIQRLFYKLVGGKVNQGAKKYDFTPMLKLPSTNDHQTMQEFSVRLVGRLVFCWFLKKKKSDAGIPLIPENILSSDVIERDYYHKTIEPLFFELLNTQIDERRDDFRNAEYDLIPFLNGGLFDPNLHEDYYRYSPMEKMYKPSYNLVIPDEWLAECITLLETYNFTIDENTSIDIDLSVDPEMLGRIFENLLAEINPETGNTARKATGSYYTPRPIVEYMVDESLIQYLLTKTDIEETAIRELLDYNIEGTELLKDQKIAVIDALDEIKVLDPACGSGAFPMGILQKMLLILQKVDPESIEWVIRQLDKIPNKLVRQALEDKLMSENWKYKHKMGIIQNAIYGVDIQPIATEISKLRLFLTLIVDENIIDEKANRNIHPLPNLSFKFVTANSLIGLGDEDEIMLHNLKMKAKFDDIREKYFYASSIGRKKEIEIEFGNLQKELLDFLTEPDVLQQNIFGGLEKSKEKKRPLKPYFYKLLNWNPFKDEPTSWFDPKWMFGIKKAFDIVIGNPPYIDSENMVKKYPDFRNQLKSIYRSAKGNWDLFVVFIEKGILLTNQNGFTTYIVPNKLISAKYTIELRNILLNLNVQELIDYSGVDVFKEADVYPIVFRVCNNTLYSKVKTKLMIDLLNEKTMFLIQPEVFHKDIYWDKYFFRKEITDLIISISRHNQLHELDFRVHGAATVGEAYKIKDFLCEYNQSITDYVKLINTGTIDPYENFWGIRQTKYIKSSYHKPIIESSKLKKISSKRLEQSNSMKLIVAGMSKNIEAYFDHGEYLAGKSTTIVLHNDEIILKALCAIFNSKAISFWFSINYNSLSMSGGYFNVGTREIESFPIPKTTLLNNKFILSKIVSDIIQYKKEMKDTKILEDQIDLMVYKLYELTYEEAKIVDPEIDKVLSQFGLSEEDYEKMSVEDLGEMRFEEKLNG